MSPFGTVHLSCCWERVTTQGRLTCGHLAASSLRCYILVPSSGTARGSRCGTGGSCIYASTYEAMFVTTEARRRRMHSKRISSTKSFGSLVIQPHEYGPTCTLCRTGRATHKIYSSRNTPPPLRCSARQVFRVKKEHALRQVWLLRTRRD